VLFSQFFLCPLFDTKGSVAYYLGVQTAVDVLADKQDGEKRFFADLLSQKRTPQLSVYIESDQGQNS
jgi:hypothetical protein